MGEKPVNRPMRGRKWQRMNGADVRQLTGFRRCTAAAYLLDGREPGAARRKASVTSGKPRSAPVAKGSNPNALPAAAFTSSYTTTVAVGATATNRAARFTVGP